MAPLLQDLANLGVEVPAALAAHPDGVPSLSTLQTSFPDAARQAIEADIRARADSGVSAGRSSLNYSSAITFGPLLMCLVPTMKESSRR